MDFEKMRERLLLELEQKNINVSELTLIDDGNSLIENIGLSSDYVLFRNDKYYAIVKENTILYLGLITESNVLKEIGLDFSTSNLVILSSVYILEENYSKVTRMFINPFNISKFKKQLQLSMLKLYENGELSEHDFKRYKEKV